jgi:hypothetical protein
MSSRWKNKIPGALNPEPVDGSLDPTIIGRNDRKLEDLGREG